MKKNTFYTAVLLLAGAAMTACSGGDDMTSDITPETQKLTENGVIELVGTLGSKGSVTRTIADDGAGSWEVGDKFAIYYATADGHSTAVATVSSINANGSANFRASLYYPKTGTSDVTLVYPSSAHDGKGGFKTDALMNQEGTLDYINANGLDFESAKTTLNVVDTKATLNSDVTMEPQVCLYKLQLMEDYYNKMVPINKLEINDGTHIYNITTTEATNIFTVALLPTENANFTFSTVTNESGPGHIYTKQIGVTLANCTSANVGNVFDSDGNIYAVSSGSGLTRIKSFSGITLERGKFYSQNMVLPKIKMPLAVIAYVGERGTVDDSSTDSQTGFHGLAISMNNSGRDNTNNNNTNWDGESFGPKWCSQSADTCTSKASVSDKVTVVREWKNGITMTNELVSHATHTHWAALTARNYNPGQYSYRDGFFSDDAAYYLTHPSGTSDWFLPSVGQWELIVWGLVSKAIGTPYSTRITDQSNDDVYFFSKFNNILSNAGADVFLLGCRNYWLSSEYSHGKAWYACYDGSAQGGSKGYVSSVNIRAVIAF